MSKKSNILIYLLGIYVVLQFIWWGYQIINLGALVDSSNAQTSRRVIMILGEGGVFILILLAGFWQIQRSIRKEIELSQNQNNFLLSVTHELKTPLTSIQLALQTLSKRDLNKEQTQTLIEKAISENERLKILIDNIIQASSIENKGLIADKKPIKIKTLLEKIVSNSNKRQENNLVNLNCPNHFDLSADIFMIETSVINILENAIKYAGSNDIILNVENDSNELRISILDQGPGIDDNEKKFIFDKFYRIGNEETRLKKGSGLGLYIAKHFIQLHQGDISYSKNNPCGSIFTISLPYE
ncbi:ATP-binding protein [Crocinitomicaceae bacterium]|nr:ATP-binding protein [Crocinitomicaceae bacterium]